MLRNLWDSEYGSCTVDVKRRWEKVKVTKVVTREEKVTELRIFTSITRFRNWGSQED
jgi:hypothetical protein